MPTVSAPMFPKVYFSFIISGFRGSFYRLHFTQAFLSFVVKPRSVLKTFVSILFDKGG
jgi:hypothetical protein